MGTYGWKWGHTKKARNDQWIQAFCAMGTDGKTWTDVAENGQKTLELNYESSALPLSYSGMGTAAVRREEILRSRADAKYIFSGAWPCEAC